mgnify:CR=1 FL=1
MDRPFTSDCRVTKGLIFLHSLLDGLCKSLPRDLLAFTFGSPNNACPDWDCHWLNVLMPGSLIPWSYVTKQIQMCEFRHQPNNLLRCLMNRSKARGLVSMSAGWSSVPILRNSKGLSCLVVNSTKWKYLTFMCLVRGLIFGNLAIARAPLESSNNLQCTTGSLGRMSNPHSFISSSTLIIGMATLNDCESPTNSASVVDKHIPVDSELFQISGTPA